MGVQSDHKRPVHGLVMELVQNVDIDSKPDLVLYRCPRNGLGLLKHFAILANNFVIPIHDSLCCVLDHRI
jgi:hypothetical protein